MAQNTALSRIQTVCQYCKDSSLKIKSVLIINFLHSQLSVHTKILGIKPLKAEDSFLSDNVILQYNYTTIFCHTFRQQCCVALNLYILNIF